MAGFQTKGDGRKPAASLDELTVLNTDAVTQPETKAIIYVPWERLPGESAKHYAAFCIYRDAGPSRSIEQVRVATGRASITNKWAKDGQWRERAAAFDAEQDRLFFAELTTKRREAAERHVATAVKLQAVAMKALEKTWGENLEKINNGTLTPKEILAFALEAAKFERMVLGEDAAPRSESGGEEKQGSSANVNVSVTTVAVAQSETPGITVDERLSQLSALLDGARARAGIAVDRGSSADTADLGARTIPEAEAIPPNRGE